MHYPPVSANALYHFTKSLDILFSILENGFYPRASLEDFTFLFPQSKALEALGLTSSVAIPMVCFTDLPLDRMTRHREFYGQYSISMTKKWGTENGLNPVHYIIPGQLPSRSFMNIQTMLISLVDKQQNLVNSQKDEAMKSVMGAFWEAAAYLKLYSTIERDKLGNTYLLLDSYTSDESHRIYYDEREWRYVVDFFNSAAPDYVNYLIGPCAEDEKARRDLNIRMERECPLKFTCKDVVNLMVTNTEEESHLKSMINSSSHFSENEKQRLCGKILNPAWTKI